MVKDDLEETQVENASSSMTKVHSVGLFQSFKGEDLGGKWW